MPNEAGRLRGDHHSQLLLFRSAGARDGGGEGWTRSWWEEERDKYRLVTSVAVLDELRQGGHSAQEEKIRLLAGLGHLEVAPETDMMVETYLRHQLMPRDDSGDARHLAIASFHRCDYLLTWNCRHLANANKTRHIRRINGLLNLAL